MIKPMTGRDGYFISDEGFVYSQWINKGIHGLTKGEMRKLGGRKLKSGHIGIQFTRNSKQFFVHRLVYEAFVGPIPEGLLIRHLNDIPFDNRIENLALGTQKDNMADCIRNGRHKSNKKIDEKEYRSIWKMKKFYTWKEIAFAYDVDEKTVRNHMKIYNGGM